MWSHGWEERITSFNGPGKCKLKTGHRDFGLTHLSLREPDVKKERGCTFSPTRDVVKELHQRLGLEGLPVRVGDASAGYPAGKAAAVGFEEALQ